MGVNSNTSRDIGPPLRCNINGISHIVLLDTITHQHNRNLKFATAEVVQTTKAEFLLNILNKDPPD